MKKRNILACLIGAVLLLSGCDKSPAETRPEATPIPTTGTSIPPTVPETTIPQPILEAGDAVTVDGDSLESGSVIDQGCLYVKASEFLAALDHASYSGDDVSGFNLTWEGQEIQLSNNLLGPVVDGQAMPLEQEMMVYQDALYIPLEAFCQLMNLSILDDTDDGRLFCTSGIKNLAVTEGVQVPVLMYHAVSDDLWGFPELFVSPSALDQQLAYLVENGYDPIFFEDLDHLEDYDKPVILTFDDGYLDNYTELYPLLQKHNVKATIFVITSVLGFSEHSMTREQVKELSDSDLVSIQSHTLTHPELSALSDEDQLEEIRDSKLIVARITGREPHVLCYPSGKRNQTTQEITGEYYNFGIDMNGGLYTTGDEPTSVSRYYVSRNTSLSEFASMVSGAGRS